MEVNLTKKQRQLLEYSIENKGLLLNDCYMIYSTHTAISIAIKRLVMLGLLEEQETLGKWKPTQKGALEVL